MCNICNKNMRIYIYKQIRVSVIVSVEYKAANTNGQGKNDMLVLFSYARCVSVRQVVYIYISCNVTMSHGVNLTYKIDHYFVIDH